LRALFLVASAGASVHVTWRRFFSWGLGRSATRFWLRNVLNIFSFLTRTYTTNDMTNTLKQKLRQMDDPKQAPNSPRLLPTNQLFHRSLLKGFLVRTQAIERKPSSNVLSTQLHKHNHLSQRTQLPD
jgi:hypothetical protein